MVDQTWKDGEGMPRDIIHLRGETASLEETSIRMTGDIDTLGRASLPTPDSTRAFWHSEPSSVLLHHRTTPSVPTKADVVIIGSGICGASAAFHLRESFPSGNRNVVMLEAREACWGATGRVSQKPYLEYSHHNGETERWSLSTHDILQRTRNWCI
jgi:hypothetical protein